MARKNRLFSADRKAEKAKQRERNRQRKLRERENQRQKKLKEKSRKPVKSSRNVDTKTYQYGIKRNGKYGRLNAAERADYNFTQGTFFGERGKEPTARDISDMKALLREKFSERDKRVQEFVDAGVNPMESMALFELKESGDDNGFENMVDYYDLISVYANIQKYLNDETSSLSGYGAWYERLFEQDGDVTYYDSDEFEGSSEFYDESDYDGGANTDRVSMGDIYKLIREMKKAFPELALNDAFISENFHYAVYLASQGMTYDEIRDTIADTFIDASNSAKKAEDNMRNFRP